MVLRGLFIGRFQPFHLGHLKAVEYIVNQVDEVILGIGSAQYSHTLENPFTAGERYVMILNSLGDLGITRNRYHLLPIEDVNVHDVWVCHVRSRVPKFEVVFSNEPLTSRLFREAGYEVQPIPFFNRDVYSATEIRLRMIEGGDWRSLVPRAVAEYIGEIDGVKRVKDLASTDKP
jgi:nicotinamide-nucleotide adenylyltransferase